MGMAKLSPEVKAARANRKKRKAPRVADWLSIRASTIDAMPATFDALQSKGYKFATVSELIAMDRPAAPKTESPKATP